MTCIVNGDTHASRPLWNTRLSTTSPVLISAQSARVKAFSALIAIAALATAGACDGTSAHTPPEIADTILLSHVAELNDDTASVIGRPSWVGEGPAGSFFVLDGSDRDVKLYDVTGRRIGTIGRAGDGPGEFGFLLAAEYLGDSLVAYDFARGMATVFSPSGAPDRTIRFPPPAPWRVRVISDSLLLAISHPSQSGELLRVLRRDGSVISSFFPRPKELSDYPAITFRSDVWADAYGDKVYAGLYGGDKIFAYTIGGTQIATLDLDLPTLASIAEDNRGQLERADGTWLNHNVPALMGLVALADDHVAYQVIPFDSRLGTDQVAGGEVTFAMLRGNRLLPIATDSVPAGLLGRDARGRALALGYTGDIEGRYYLARLAPPPGNP